MGNPRIGKINKIHKQEIESDVKNALSLIAKGFVLIENNTALEHKEGGYIKISKRVTNIFNKNELYFKFHNNNMELQNHINKIKERDGVYSVNGNNIAYLFR